MSAARPDDFLTEDEVVERYRNALTAGTLRNWRSKGSGPAFLRVGKAVLYSVRDLETWEAQQRIDPARTPADS